MNKNNNKNYAQLYELQLAREEQSKGAGVVRYQNSVVKAQEQGLNAMTAPAVKLLKQILIPCEDAVKIVIEQFYKNNRSIFKARVIEALGADRTAYLTLQAIINNLGKKVNSVAMSLARDIEQNVNLELGLKSEQVGGLLAYLIKEKYKGADKKYMSIGLDRARRKELNLPARKDKVYGIIEDKGELINVTLTEEEKMSIGTALLSAITEACSGFEFNSSEGLFVLENVTEIKNGKAYQIRYIHPTQAYIDYIQAGHEIMEAIRPTFEPCLVKPNDWSTPYDGGYLSMRLPALKGTKRDYNLDLHDAGVLQPVYDLLNTLQGVGFKYNEIVAKTALELWESGNNWYMFPQKHFGELPAKPTGAEGREEEFAKEYPEEWKRWKAECSKIHRVNESVTRLTEVAECDQRLKYANKHIDDLGNATFHEVYQVDFRIRAYPVATIIHSQGDDLSKALYRFAQGKPLDNASVTWLKIHLANCWANDKLDKKELTDRIQWVNDNEERILQAGKDPLADLWWTEANCSKDKHGIIISSSPWQFLAACADYAGWLENGENHISHIAVSVDGSCNGIQHYAALMRSREDGELVNLVNTQKPADIYALVAETTNGFLQQIAAGQVLKNIIGKGKDGEDSFGKEVATELAKLYAGTIKRSQAKRPTMTYSYSVSYSGIKDQLKHDSPELFVDMDRAQKKAALSFLAKCILEAIKTTVKSAAIGMDYLKALASACADKGLPMRWKLPDGVEVTQAYYKQTVKNVETVLNGGIKVKKDKINLIQSDLANLKGANISDLLLTYDREGRPVDQAKIELKEAKKLIVEGNLLSLYRNEVADLLEAYGDTFDFIDYLNKRLQVKGVTLAGVNQEAVLHTFTQVIVKVMSNRHLAITEKDYVDEETGEVTTKKIYAQINTPTDEIDGPAQIRGIGPNFIHSLDACHMRMTVKALEELGVKNFQMVHDSYGTLAADMGIMSQVLREKFVELHSNPIFEQAGDYLVEQNILEKEVVDAIKAKYLTKTGDLDITEVLTSTYFFM